MDAAEQSDLRGLDASVVVLLTGPLAPPAAAHELATALGRYGPVLAPRLDPHPVRPADLRVPALQVLTALAAAGADRVVLCGVGFGALVALQVAAGQPRHVAGLVLSTQARAFSGAVRSVHGGVAGLLPASTLQRLGRRTALVALQEVRTLDFRPLTPLVRAPALVLHGADDPDNARSSARLAAALSAGSVQAVPRATPGWVWREPARWADAAAPFLRRHGVPGTRDEHG